MWSIGLSIGEAFVEIIAQRDSKKISKRWFLPQMDLEKPLLQFLTENQITEINDLNISTQLAKKVLNKKLSSAPAHLITSGFEEWLEMNLPIATNHFSLEPKRIPHLLSRDLIFGISERINTKGEIEKPLDISELEFLVSKLKLSNVQNVVITFLHSHKNAEHEKKATQHLTEAGFKVYNSLDVSDCADEKSRWWNCILNAYLDPFLKETFTKLKTAIETQLGKPIGRISFLQDQNFSVEDANYLPVLFSEQMRWMASSKSQDYKNILYLGLEDFYLIQPDKGYSSQYTSTFGKVFSKTPPVHRFKIQPTSLIQQSFWGCASFDSEELGYEPGPMCMGKGLKVTFLDILYLTKDLSRVEGLSEKLNPKAKNRIEEILYTNSKGGTGMDRLSSNEVVEGVLNLAIQQMAQELLCQVSDKKVFVCGPLASILTTELKKLGKKIKFELEKEDMMNLAQNGLMELKAEA